MAYYDDVPKKKTKVNYAEKGSWDEEGSHYQDGGRQNTARFKSKKNESKRHEDSIRYSQRNKDLSYIKEGKTEKLGKSRIDKEKRRESLYMENRENASKKKTFMTDESFPKNGKKTTEYKRIHKAEPDKTGYQSFEYRPPLETNTHADEDNYILCGRNPIREALRSGREIEKLLVQKGELNSTAREIVQEARMKKINVQETDKHRMDEIAPHHQGLIAIASAYEYSSVEDILAAAEEKHENPFIVMLDGVTDPHNLGAIIRTAECVGAHGVIIPLHRSVGLTPAAVKASAGAVEHIKVARVMNLNRTIDELKKAGIWVYGLTMDGKDYEKVDFQGGTVLVIGAEGEGISRLTLERCDMTVSLPMSGKIDSLNASVAAGIMMYRVLSCRKNRK